MKIGLDVGSTTIKCVVLDDADKIIYKFNYGFELEKFITSILTTFDSHVTFTVWECDDNE